MINRVRLIAYMGMGIALYVVVSLSLNIPFGIRHMRLDLGYIVYTVYLALFGYWGIVVGVVGCCIKGYISDGWIPFTWMIGQTLIGIVCAGTFSKTANVTRWVAAIVVSVFFGIAIVSSGLSALMFHLPLGAKIIAGTVGAISDSIVMILGIPIAKMMRTRYGTLIRY